MTTLTHSVAATKATTKTMRDTQILIGGMFVSSLAAYAVNPLGALQMASLKVAFLLSFAIWAVILLARNRLPVSLAGVGVTLIFGGITGAMAAAAATLAGSQAEAFAALGATFAVYIVICIASTHISASLRGLTKYLVIASIAALIAVIVGTVAGVQIVKPAAFAALSSLWILFQLNEIQHEENENYVAAAISIYGDLLSIFLSFMRK